MCFDSARGKVVLFGGSAPGVIYFGDTWEWDGTTWLERQIVGPSPRTFASACFDPNRKRVVLFGGRNTASGGALNDLWEYDGSAWAQVSATGPMAGVNTWSAAVFDHNTASVVFAVATSPPTVWSWDGSAWAQRPNAPSAVFPHCLAFDYPNSRLVMFGGGDFNPEMWALEGNTWHFIGYFASIPRREVALYTDSNRGRVFLYGGIRDGFVMEDTWSWRDAVWTYHDDYGPGQKLGFGIAYDSSRDRAVMFGGYDTNANVLVSETWERAHDAPHTVGITLQPVCEVAHLGGMVSFVVGAAGTSPLEYQWYHNGDAVVNSERIFGAQTPTLSITEVAPSDEGHYDVTVTNACGMDVRSNTVELAVFTVLCPGDSNGDGQVTFVDLNIVLAHWGQMGCRPPGDVTHDGWVNFGDLNLVLSSFGLVCVN